MAKNGLLALKIYLVISACILSALAGFMFAAMLYEKPGMTQNRISE